MLENTKPRILAIGDPDSCLTRERVQFGCDAGYEMHWYAPAVADYWGRVPEFDVNGVVCHRFPGPWIPKISALQEVVFLQRLVRRISPCLVHVFMAHPRFYNLVLARQLPLLVTVMGADVLPDQGFNNFRRRLLTRTLLKRARYITSKSQFLDDAIAAVGVANSSILRVTWGVDRDVFRPGLDVSALRKELRISNNTNVFFSLRACHPFYRHEHIISAFSRCRASLPEESVLLISRAAERAGYVDQLRETAKRLGVEEDLRIVGPIPPGDMPRYLNLATCAVAVPPSDGMPQSLYECLACQCFPILGDLPQYQELVTHTEEGYLVALDSEEELANAMLWVVKNRDRVVSGGESSRRRVLEVADKRVQMGIVNDLYTELCET